MRILKIERSMTLLHDFHSAKVKRWQSNTIRSNDGLLFFSSNEKPDPGSGIRLGRKSSVKW